MTMPEEGKNNLKYNQDKRYLKVSIIIYANTDSLLEITNKLLVIRQKGESQNGCYKTGFNTR